MNRIDKLFEEKRNGVISVYFTAGYPQLNDTSAIIENLEKAGVDMLEIGIPFSDPLADGPIIQHSSKLALKNGMSLKLLFEQLTGIREKVKIPLLLMSYLNPVMQYGFNEFCQHAASVGIDGLVLPDLPPEIYKAECKKVMDKNNLKNILLVSPTTSENRLKSILNQANGFVYMVSSNSTTGSERSATDNLQFVSRIRMLNKKIPVMVGFGINSREKIDMVNQYANGSIIGSYFIQHLNGEVKNSIKTFMNQIKS